MPTPRTHILRQLAARLSALGAAPPPDEAVRFLDAYGVGVRYPDADPPLAATAITAIEHAKTIVDFVQQQLQPNDEPEENHEQRE